MRSRVTQGVDFIGVFFLSVCLVPPLHNVATHDLPRLVPSGGSVLLRLLCEKYPRFWSEPWLMSFQLMHSSFKGQGERLGVGGGGVTG